MAAIIWSNFLHRLRRSGSLGRSPVAGAGLRCAGFTARLLPLPAARAARAALEADGGRLGADLARTLLFGQSHAQLLRVLDLFHYLHARHADKLPRMTRDYEAQAQRLPASAFR